MIKIFKNFMHRVKRKPHLEEEKLLKQKLKNNKNNDDQDNQDDQESNDDEFRALYLNKEKEYIFNPKETQDFDDQSEFKGSEEYSLNLSKDHTNRFNEESEKNFFTKLFNIFLSQKLLSALTILLTKLSAIADLISPSLNLKSKTKYKVVNSLLKLLIKIQLSLSLRLIQMLLSINQKLIEFDKKYIGGTSLSKKRQEDNSRIINNSENRQRSREQYRSFEIGNLEEQKRSEYLRNKAFNQNRENIINRENELKKYQDISISKLKNIENKIEISQSSSTEKISPSKSEDSVARYMQNQEYIRLIGISYGKEKFSLEGSLLSKLLGIAKVVYNNVKEFYKNSLSEYIKFDSNNINKDTYKATSSYKENTSNSQEHKYSKDDSLSPKFGNTIEGDFQIQDWKKVEEKGENILRGL